MDEEALKSIREIIAAVKDFLKKINPYGIRDINDDLVFDATGVLLRRKKLPDAITTQFAYMLYGHATIRYMECSSQDVLEAFYYGVQSHRMFLLLDIPVMAEQILRELKEWFESMEIDMRDLFTDDDQEDHMLAIRPPLAHAVLMFKPTYGPTIPYASQPALSFQ